MNKNSIKTEKAHFTLSFEDNHLKKYLKQISHIKLLTKEEEYELGKRCQKGDSIAKKQLAKANLRLVVNIAKKYKNRGLTLIELIQEGNLGLLKAVERYDYTLGFRFTTYATWWIRQTVTKAIAEQSKSVKLPIHMFDTINKIIATKRELEASNTNPQEVIEKLKNTFNFNEEKITELLNISHIMISLDEELRNNDGSKNQLLSFIEDKNNCTETYAINEDLKNDCINILQNLKKKEGIVLFLRLGFDKGVPRTLEDIGKIFGVTKECIRQTELRAINHIKDNELFRNILMTYL